MSSGQKRQRSSNSQAVRGVPLKPSGPTAEGASQASGYEVPNIIDTFIAALKESLATPRASGYMLVEPSCNPCVAGRGTAEIAEQVKRQIATSAADPSPLDFPEGGG